MLAILSRRSSRARNAYICSSCLGHVESPLLPRLSGSANANATFSTTSIYWQDEGTSVVEGASTASKMEIKDPLTKGSKRKRRRPLLARGWKSLQPAKLAQKTKATSDTLSGSAEALDALKESMLAEDKAARSIKAGASAKTKEVEATGSKRKTVVNQGETVSSSKDGSKVVKVAKVGKKSVPKDKKPSSPKPKPDPGANGSKTPDVKKGDKSTGSKKVQGPKITKIATTSLKDNKSLSDIVAQDPQGPVRKVMSEKPETMKISKYVPQGPWAKKWIEAIASNQDGGSGFKRAILLKLIEKGNLSPQDVEPAVKLLRNAIQEDQQKRNENQSIKQAMQEKRVAKSHSPSGLRITRQPGKGPVMSPIKPKTKRTKNVLEEDEENTNAPMRGTIKHEIESIKASDLKLVPLDTGPLDVPKLSYGLERVLFNPGVYQLQDPRSRVFNFDPYLQTIMPVSEFDFNALKEYITSSKDSTLLDIARAEKRKYTGSTSSMTSALGHFHFLLSQWRPINAGTLSRDFPAQLTSFTLLQRGPTAIFLRYKDGVYAIDADKEFDTANILSSLGKSMEKLLTLPTHDFEKYRKPNSDQITQEERDADEAFHYTTMGDFLMRSQLDAYDSRLPGTGMFDLKTRAVVAIRMDTTKYEEGSGYEIRQRHGEWESFEREYYDMIRAAFLKYSLQVRMGRMDGIFVAFHNTERIFGFQYISLSEMDLALHGTDDTSIGDSEFKLSVDLLNRVLDRATAKYPEKSLRLFFETRAGDAPFMYIFAEPVDEKEIDQIQTSNKAEIEEFESRVLGLEKEESEEKKRQAEWDSLYSKVEETMDQDESGLIVDEDDVIDDHGSDSGVWDAEERQKVEDFIKTAAQEDGVQDEEEEEEEDDETDLVDSDEEEIDQDDGAIEEHDEHDEKEGDELEEHEGSDEELEVEILEGKFLPSGIEHEISEEINTEETEEETTESEIVSDEQESRIEETSKVSEDEEKQVEEIPAESESSIDDKSEEIAIETQEDSTDAEQIDETENPESSSDPTENNLFTVGKSDPVEAEVEAEAEAEAEDDIFAMTLTVRNKVNGKYVKRPNNLDSSDEWTVEYSLAEVKEPVRARKLYNMAKGRRSKVLNRSHSKSTAWNDSYVEGLMEMAKKGRKYRMEMDEKENGKPKMVLDLRDVGVFEKSKGESEPEK